MLLPLSAARSAAADLSHTPSYRHRTIISTIAKPIIEKRFQTQDPKGFQKPFGSAKNLGHTHAALQACMSRQDGIECS
jgi:hypothetical protein